ncbi:hypothetical protein B0T20DRAFT_393091 [Sordaria brevicollis]|uniref:Uncharacterized protein n=1 Tax=Sordaria brevicollis TaxID=83679 RepID=A0AAE0PEV6_SORBR|nr:hypothetical protein B0T20DRAFT_393091 [Sordaria brevicollis]
MNNFSSGLTTKGPFIRGKFIKKKSQVEPFSTLTNFLWRLKQPNNIPQVEISKAAWDAYTFHVKCTYPLRPVEDILSTTYRTQSSLSKKTSLWLKRRQLASKIDKRMLKDALSQTIVLPRNNNHVRKIIVNLSNSRLEEAWEAARELYVSYVCQSYPQVIETRVPEFDERLGPFLDRLKEEFGFYTEGPPHFDGKIAKWVVAKTIFESGEVESSDSSDSESNNDNQRLVGQDVVLIDCPEDAPAEALLEAASLFICSVQRMSMAIGPYVN